MSKLKNKLVYDLALITIVYVVIILLLNHFGFAIGNGDSSDFLSQHLKFFEYLRNNFWYSHDLFPQFNQSFGLGQSFVTMYYYGMYNPLLMLSYIIPLINPFSYFLLMYYILIISAFFAMRLLLNRLNYDELIVRTVSIMAAFTGTMLHHFAEHLMFMYYVPVMILSLYAIHLLVEENKKYLYIICVALIFFTNYFFAPLVSILQFSYFILIAKKANKLNIKLIGSYFLAYLIGVLIGMIILLPTALFAFHGARSSESFVMNTYFKNPSEFIGDIIIRGYNGGLGIIATIVLLGSIFKFKQQKYAGFIIMAMVFAVVVPINVFLNVFLYDNNKILIYFSPFFFLSFAEVLRIYSRKGLLKLSAVAILITLFLYVNVANHEAQFNLRYYQMLAIIISFIGMLFIVSSPKFVNRTVIGLTIFLFAIFFEFVTFYPVDYASQYETLNGDVQKLDIGDMNSMYRTNEEAYNSLTSLADKSPTLYASLQNNNALNLVSEKYFAFTESSTPRASYVTNFDNAYYQSFLGINKDSLGNTYNLKVNPIVYGVNKDNISNMKTLDDLDAKDRVLAINQNLFVDDDSYDAEYNNQFAIDYAHIAANELTFASPQEGYLDMSQIITKPGIYTLAFDETYYGDPQANSKIAQKYRIGNQSGYAIYVPKTDDSNQEESTMSFNVTADDMNYIKQIKYSVEAPMVANGAIEYSNFRVYYQSADNFNANKQEVIVPENFETNFNHGYEFDLTMDQEGYIATSLPNDPGFKVLVDGKEVASETVNKYFLGAKIPKGKHHVVIDYEIPGFKLGLIFTIIGIIALTMIMIKEIAFFNHSAIRFITVGAINTLNYYSLFRILLLQLPFLPAHIVAFIYAAVVSYVLSSIFTFKREMSWQTLIKFPLTFLPNLILSSVGSVILVKLGICSDKYATLIMMILAIPITYLVAKIIFRHK